MMRAATPQLLALLNGAVFAASFDGSTQYINAALLSAITQSGTWFSYFRFNQDAGNANTGVVWNNNQTSSDLCGVEITQAGVIRFGVFNGSTWSAKSATVSNGVWHDVLCICTAGVASMYVDGVLATGTANPASFSVGSYNRIGANSTPGKRFKGKLDHLAWYSGFAPTAAQITELREAGELQGIKPLAFIGFDEGQGSTISVSGTASGTATWVGTPAYVKETPFGTPASTFYMADLYTFSLHDGTTLRYTSADVNLNVGGTIYSCTGPVLKRGKTRSTVGIEVDTLSINVYDNGGQSINSTPWIQSVRMGKLDDARVRLDRLIAKTWNDTNASTLLMFEGRVASVTAQRYEATLDVVSDLELLDVKLPRPVFQSGCMNNFGDSGCKMVKSSLAVTGTVTSATTSAITTALTQAADFFTLGTITFTSGANNGLTRGVRAFSGGVFTPANPFPSVALPGDTFVANPGCNKSRDPTTGDCVIKFNNVINFRAFPYIPLPETTL